MFKRLRQKFVSRETLLDTMLQQADVNLTLLKRTRELGDEVIALRAELTDVRRDLETFAILATEADYKAGTALTKLEVDGKAMERKESILPTEKDADTFSRKDSCK